MRISGYCLRLLGIICLSLIVIASRAAEPVVKSGNTILSVGYGAPNSDRFEPLNDPIRSRNLTSYGPIFLKGEYMAGQRLGLGLNLSSRAYGYEDRYTTGQVFNWNRTDMRILLQGAWHPITTQNWDVYVTAGAGLSYRVTKQNGSYINNLDLEVSVNNQKDETLKEAFSVGAGIRYFPIKNFGIYAETGLDQNAMVQGGLLLKF